MATLSYVVQAHWSGVAVDVQTLKLQARWSSAAVDVSGDLERNSR
jgi:hypothetical protein